MPSKKVAVKRNPNLDWAIGLLGGQPVPTKQDKFKPLKGYEGVMEENGEETILKDLYVKNPSAHLIKEFEIRLKEFIKENLRPEHPYKSPTKVEVILGFDIPEKRFYDVDVDNLSKYVLDCMNGLVFEDDSQVIKLLAMKEIHPWNTNGLMIGVNIIDNPAKSWFNVKLFYMEDVAE